MYTINKDPVLLINTPHYGSKWELFLTFHLQYQVTVMENNPEGGGHWVSVGWLVLSSSFASFRVPAVLLYQPCSLGLS